MDSKNKIDIINSFQNLIPVDCGDNKVILKCLDCGYTQNIDENFIELLFQLDTQQRKLKEIYKFD